MCVLYKLAIFLLGVMEREKEASRSRRKMWRRKKRRRRRGRCEESSETNAGCPVKEKTEGGRDCMKARGEEACE